MTLVWCCEGRGIESIVAKKTHSVFLEIQNSEPTKRVIVERRRALKARRMQPFLDLEKFQNEAAKVFNDLVDIANHAEFDAEGHRGTPAQKCRRRPAKWLASRI